jgi:transketolase
LTEQTYRAPEPCHPSSWSLETSYRLAKSMVAGEVLAGLADNDDRIVVLTADLKYSNRTADFEAAHPERFFNVGIAEQNMVSMAAGIATFGYVPYVATFSSFVSLLCAEQLRTDLAYPDLPVRVIAHHAGISLGFYGTSHHATEDLGLLRSVARMTVVCPCDAASTRAAIETTVDRDGPIYFRVGRGRDPDVYERNDSRFAVGRISTLRDGDDLTLVANGAMVAPAIMAAEKLREQGARIAVLDAHTVRPFDSKTLCDQAERTGRLLVVEEHNVYGGVATACADALVDAGLTGIRFRRAGMPADEYALIGSPNSLYRYYGLDQEGIAKRAAALLQE